MKLRELLWVLPSLALYLALIAGAATDEWWGDEGRYVNYARNLTEGFYTTRENPDLLSGPGYPFVLVPFVAAGAPLLAMKLFNAVLLFAAVCLMYATARLYTDRVRALICAGLFALYPPFLRYTPYVLSESLTIMLATGSVLLLCLWYRTRRTGALVGAGLFLAYLALTKVSFGYVLMAGFVLFLAASLLRALRPARRAAWACGLALLLCSPYLIYTFSLTGRVLFWGNAGAGNFYYLTSPYDGEYGDWFSIEETLTNPNLARHKALYEQLKDLSPIERGDRWMQEGWKNIRRYPAKWAKNWALNISRMLINYPLSYTPQKPSTLFYIVPNMILVTVMLLLIYPTVVGRRRLPPEVFVLLTIAVLALGGTSFASSDVRHFAPTVPMLAVWILVTLTRVVRVRLVREPAGQGAGAQAA
jgi:4-amino-4-deoxy-L-arabinose transferase-like glycosyltransferase